MLFAPDKNHVQRAEAYMHGFYSVIKRASGEPFDERIVAQREVSWWIVHRNLSGCPEKGLLERSLAESTPRFVAGRPPVTKQPRTIVVRR